MEGANREELLAALREQRHDQGRVEGACSWLSAQ
jgi:hypothetical protein